MFSKVFYYPLAVVLLLVPVGSAHGDGPAENRPEQVRPIPPKGIELDPSAMATLLARCKSIRTQWQLLHEQQAANEENLSNQQVKSFEPEVLVFPRAVELAIEFGQFYKPGDTDLASKLLDEASRRLNVVSSGGNWYQVIGFRDQQEQQLLVGGFRSSIDQSIQPYSIVIPSGFAAHDARPRRLDLWFHGRGEKLSEVTFLSNQKRNAGPYTPQDTFVLHPYGRYSNAFKFAGEIDVLESLQYIQSRLPVDTRRISVRGFSMGGAACWQFATHYSDRWFAANPGAGFSETPDFLQSFQNEPVQKTTPSYQKTLWQLYDCPVWANNLTNCPTVAYSGEVDRQKQAADVMEATLREKGIKLVHVIGPNTAHKIHPDSKLEIEQRMQQLAQAVPNRMPSRVEFTTVTLRYHKMHWLDVQGLEQHWTPATVIAEVQGSTIHVSTKNINRLRLTFPPGQWPGHPRNQVQVTIDGTTLSGPMVSSDRSWQWELSRSEGSWKPAIPSQTRRKRPGLQGPIDDAFMSTFLFVLPSGRSDDPTVQDWVTQESKHARNHWRKHFRGDIQQTEDRDVTAQDISSCNLILFGDPTSNSFLKRIESELPVKWKQEEIAIGNQSVPRQGHVPVMIFPNPLNPNRYVVINSGFTFREYDYLNNARQTPKLPDWGLIDIRRGATSQFPGEVKAAGFFDEQWEP